MNDKIAIGAKSAQARVAILLCTHNSSEFLNEQINSFFAQTYDNWELWVSDDDSRDDTLDIIKSYAGKGKKIVLLNGPCRGATVNFLSLLRNPEIETEYSAWSDADDIWLPDKLERAIHCLDGVRNEQAALYCGRTQVVDENNKEMYLTPLFTQLPCFKNALCQNIGAGNTMLLNRKARELLCVGNFPEVPFHDWWAYIVVSGCGGVVQYDPKPCLNYRQHGCNLVGCDMGLTARVRRCRRFFNGEMNKWLRNHLTALESRRDYLTNDSRIALDAFARSMNAQYFWERARYFKRSGVFCQGYIQHIILWMELTFGIRL